MFITKLSEWYKKNKSHARVSKESDLNDNSTPVLIINQSTNLPATAWGGGGICERSISFPSSKALITLSNCCEQNQS